MDERDPMTAALGTNLVAYFTLQQGDFPRARRFGERAIRHFRAADALFGELHLYAHIGQAELAVGDVAAAEASYLKMRELCRERLGEGSDLEAIAGVLAAETRYLADDRAAARELLAPALARIEAADGWFDIFASAYLTAARLELADHGPAAAYAAIERGQATAARRSMGRLTVLLGQESIRVATLSGDLDRALAACREAGISLALADAIEAGRPVSSLRGDGPAVIAARLLMKLDQADEALAFIAAADEQARSIGTPLSRRITARVVRALLEARLGNRVQARAMLSAATGLAGPEKLSRALLDEGDEIRQLAEELADEPHADTMFRERIGRLLGTGHAPALGAREPADFILSGRERQILDLLAEGLTNKEIARRIGLDPNTVKYHLKRLFAKLAVQRRVSAVVRARTFGLLA
jgi:LuxR family transcriptional regulator, maltose regulon positive regulatory protein